MQHQPIVKRFNGTHEWAHRPYQLLSAPYRPRLNNFAPHSLSILHNDRGWFNSIHPQSWIFFEPWNPPPSPKTPIHQPNMFIISNDTQQICHDILGWVKNIVPSLMDSCPVTHNISCEYPKCNLLNTHSRWNSKISSWKQSGNLSQLFWMTKVSTRIIFCWIAC